MAACYHPAAHFQDIAFDLRGRDRIAAMWGMICDTDLQPAFQIVQAGEESAVASVIDEYTFTETGRRVRNVIESRFRFRDGLIVEHIDSCDARLWAEMALGGVAGFLAGRIGFLRKWKAASLLQTWQANHPADN
jgi:hypothetical protein